ncbi:Rz1-like lysis system protein LysC [Photobacterium atrarenae]|uniref:Uncharacterized protein n=1 Tax=Photobacterium atrarenae TaxID=865757 RepID=A0ABY5GC62_9GAMM|nr:hypothetical protein [Photobacterium atrarenae]UTV26395.1 hypothetical protein NNL38_08360 [Photobacterium atrarenae]
MKIAIPGLCLALLLNGCTTTEVVTEYREVVLKPPASDLTVCLQPFDLPPATYGEAVERDPVWFAAWKECANKILRLRAFYGFDSGFEPAFEYSFQALPNTGE